MPIVGIDILSNLVGPGLGTWSARRQSEGLPITLDRQVPQAQPFDFVGLGS
jgi:hypothetical protein